MSSYFPINRLTAFCAVCAVLLTANCWAADPKVVKASHEQRAGAEETNAAEPKKQDLSYSPEWPEPPNTGAMLMRLGFGTIAVLALCVTTLWLGKPWLQKLQVKSAGHPEFYIEGSISTGNRATLYLVRVGQTQLIAGTDATGLKSLIALPQTFKDVLDQQVPETDIELTAPATPPAPRPVEKTLPTSPLFESTLPRPFAGQTSFRSGVKD